MWFTLSATVVGRRRNTGWQECWFFDEIHGKFRFFIYRNARTITNISDHDIFLYVQIRQIPGA